MLLARTHEVQGLFVDDLFKRIQEPSTALTARYPKLETLWEPLDDGSWRGAHPRTSAWTTVEPGWLPKEALETDRARAQAVEKKELTPEEGRSIITAIVLEYD